MQIVSIDSSNFQSLTSQYSPDPSLNLNENVLYTEQGISFPISNLYTNINDVRTNNYSTLFLTQLATLSSQFNIRPLAPLNNPGFSTYIAINAINGINGSSVFWVVEEPDIEVNSAAVSVSGNFVNIQNNYFFDIIFLDDQTCKIQHVNAGIARYLTADYTGTLSFAKDAHLDNLGSYSPQIFYYDYNSTNGILTLFKNLSDIIQIVYVNKSSNTLSLTTPVTGNAAFNLLTLFSVLPQNGANATDAIYDSWVAYQKNLQTQTQEINSLFSFGNINSNLLLNNEFTTISGNTRDINILSLKNTNTAEDRQSRNNPFLDQIPVQFREYQQIFSGSNQIHGNDNISLGYETYSTNIPLPADKVTYFHMPQNMFPLQYINVKDAGLIESGAIAGDHPLKSDLIFKKRADYKNTSNFGNSIDENSGSFLCAWLSGSVDPTVKPVWVDRYYNPQVISFFSALTTSNFSILGYQNEFSWIVSQAAQLNVTTPVFDKPSDLIFEPGTYYAYYHYGVQGVGQYLESLEPTLIQSDPFNFQYVTGSALNYSTDIPIEGNVYAQTVPLTSIGEQFTVSFFANNQDWNIPFAHQIIGNYSNDGFGLFNQNTLTPLLWVYNQNLLYILNTSYQIVNTVTFPDTIIKVIPLEGMQNFYVILANGSILAVDNQGNILQQSSFGTTNQYVNLVYTLSAAFILINNGNNNAHLFNYNFNNRQVNDITYSQNINFNFPDVINSIHQAQTVSYYQSRFYFTPGEKAAIVGDNLFFLQGNNLFSWNNFQTSTEVTTAFNAGTSLDDFAVDLEGNIWILFNKNKFTQYTANRVFVLSGEFSDSYQNYAINFAADFNHGQYSTYPIITRQLGISSNTLAFYTLDTQGDILSATQFFATTAANFELTNFEFIRNNVAPNYPSASLNVKATLVNPLNLTDSITPNIIFNLSALDPGWHHFAIRFDSFFGFIYLFIDGQTVGVTQFTPGKYRFNSLLNRPFLIGSSTYNFSTPLYRYLKNNSYLATNLILKDIYLYSAALNTFDIMFHARAGMNIQDINLSVAAGRRNYIEEIERYFKFTLPGAKSTLFNLLIKNSGITDAALQQALELRILAQLQQITPVTTRINSIQWIN